MEIKILDAIGHEKRRNIVLSLPTAFARRIAVGYEKKYIHRVHERVLGTQDIFFFLHFLVRNYGTYSYSRNGLPPSKTAHTISHRTRISIPSPLTDIISNTKFDPR